VWITLVVRKWQNEFQYNMSNAALHASKPLYLRQMPPYRNLRQTPLCWTKKAALHASHDLVKSALMHQMQRGICDKCRDAFSDL
jgi:hypothetical protein